MFTVETKKKNQEERRKILSLLYHIPFYSGFFPFTFLPYVYVCSCTYAQDFQKQKKTEAKEEKKIKCLLPILLQKHCLEEGKEKKIMLAKECIGRGIFLN